MEGTNVSSTTQYDSKHINITEEVSNVGTALFKTKKKERKPYFRMILGQNTNNVLSLPPEVSKIRFFLVANKRS